MIRASHDETVETAGHEQQNELFDALGSHRSRYALYACLQTDGELTLSVIADQVAAWEYDKPIAEVTSTEHKRVYTSLQQHHLSKLERSGLITIDDKSIDCTEKAQQLDLYIELVPESDVPWSLYYLGLSTIGGFILGLKAIGFLPDPISPQVLTGILLLAFFCSSLVHYRHSNRVTFGPSDRPLEIAD
ncbi:winged helix-turn-helix domain-containing protein [Halostagnicola bangensis]